MIYSKIRHHFLLHITHILKWITTKSIMNAAEQAGIDIAQLKTDMAGSAVESIITRTRQAAEALQLTGTPALVIGDTIVRGAVDIDEFRRLIAAERAKQG